MSEMTDSKVDTATKLSDKTFPIDPDMRYRRIRSICDEYILRIYFGVSNEEISNACEQYDRKFRISVTIGQSQHDDLILPNALNRLVDEHIQPSPEDSDSMLLLQKYYHLANELAGTVSNRMQQIADKYKSMDGQAISDIFTMFRNYLNTNVPPPVVAENGLEKITKIILEAGLPAITKINTMTADDVSSMKKQNEFFARAAAY